MSPRGGRVVPDVASRIARNSARSRCAIRATAAASLLLHCAARAVIDFPIYLFIFIVFLNRYVFGLYLTLVRGKKLDETIEGYEPTVTVVVPLFNEGRSIYDTIVEPRRSSTTRSDKLEVTVVDDCSTDDSYEWACKARRASSRTSACCATRSTWASARASTTRCASRRPRSSSRSTPT